VSSCAVRQARHSQVCGLDKSNVSRHVTSQVEFGLYLLYLPVLYLYCNSFFIRDVHGEFGLQMCIVYDVLPAISSRKVGIFPSGEW